MTRIAWYAAVVTGTVIFLILLWQFSAALALFLLSLAIAAALKPVIHWVSSGRLSRAAGLAIVYTLLIAGIVLGWLFIGPPLLRDVQQATNDFLTSYQQAKADWPYQGTVFQKMLADQLPPADEIYNSLTTAEGMGALESIFGVARGVFSLLGFLLIGIILSIYWSADQYRFERLGLSLLPSEQHTKALRTWRAVETRVGAFIRSETMQSLVALILLGLGYAGLNLKYPILLAIWVAVARLVPWFGVLMALAPTVPIWMGVSPAAGFIYAIFTLSVLIVIRRSIQPRIFEAPQYSSLPVLLLIVALAEGFGLVGILMAPLLGLILGVVLQELTPAPAGGSTPDVIRKTSNILVRLSALRRSLPSGAGSEPAVLVNRLRSLARSTRDYLRGY
jgi:predicted PurR-regulated permease PerM